MTKQDLCELTIMEVSALVKIAAAGLHRQNPQAADAMRGTAVALEKKKANIAKRIVESIGGE